MAGTTSIWSARLVGRQRAVEEHCVVVLDRLLDHAERAGPIALVLDEQGALALIDLGRDLLDERVVDAGVVDLAAQATEDAARRAADHRPGRAEDERADDHA